MFCAGCAHYVETKISDLGLCTQSRDSQSRPSLVDADCKACSKYLGAYALDTNLDPTQIQTGV